MFTNDGDKPNLIYGKIKCPSNSLPHQIVPYIKSWKFRDKKYTFIVDATKSDGIVTDDNCGPLLELKHDDLIISIKRHHSECNLQIDVDQREFIKDALDEESLFYRKLPSFSTLNNKKNIIVEFSSPNIAKPFHMGHLRSTIVGNFVANINKYMSNNVFRMNYLGDWGTQFGLLKVGLKMSNLTDYDVQKNPIKTLYEAYVRANRMMETDEKILEEAKSIFYKMEFADDDDEDVKQWNLYREYSVQELSRIYKRLNITFDEFSWESDYSVKRTQPVLNMIKHSDFVKNKSGQLVIDVFNESVPLLKSDGSTLYITRDIAAVMDRYDRYKFDSMLYVVDYSQANYFKRLKAILDKFNINCSSKIRHIGFGRILGMSTRKGQVIFLEDILNNAKDIMKQKQLECPTTKVIPGGEISDILAVSSLMIYDLIHARGSNYTFHLESAIQVEGRSGSRLQYVHCRLISLEKNSGASLPDICDPDVLLETEALLLIEEIARFDDVIQNSYSLLEARILVLYLFKLCGVINKAFAVLKIKGQHPYIGSQRLLLFNRARMVLNEGMQILGLTPLDQM